MYILNGWTPGDNIGKPTCRNASTVDYFVCSPSLFDSVIELFVDDFCCMYSDVHCPVYVIFNFNCYTSLINSENNDTRTVRSWEIDKKDTFITNIDKDKLNIILNKLNVMQNTNDINNNNINDMLTK